jgi:predicted metal-dependent phosphotriesterase family hydrolase
VLPKLTARGVAQADIDSMMVAAPASLFANIAK